MGVCQSAIEESFPLLSTDGSGMEHGHFPLSLIPFSAGPREPCPNLAPSILPFLTVTQAFCGKRDREAIPEIHPEKCFDISEGQSTPSPQHFFDLAFTCLTAYIWPPCTGPFLLVPEAKHVKKTLAQCVLRFFWTSFIPSLWLEMSTN